MWILYTLWMAGAYIVNLIEDLFRMLVGLNPVQSGVVSGADITTLIINNRGVRQIFTNLVAFATIMLIFFTILQIIREHYKDKHGGNPYVLVFRMVKAMVLFMFVTAACVIGLQLSGVILRALDRATGYDPDGGIGGVIFVAMAAQGNRVSQGVEYAVSDANLYAACIAANREKGWEWMTNPTQIPIYYGADPNKPYEGEVKYPDKCPHWYNPFCRCTPEVAPSYSEEQSATAEFLPNQYYLGIKDMTGGASDTLNPKFVKDGEDKAEVPYYVIRFDVSELAAGAFSPSAYPDGNGQGGYAYKHGGYGAVRDLYGINSWHTCREVFQRNLAIYILDGNGAPKRAARDWNNKNTKNEHKGFARISAHAKGDNAIDAHAFYLGNDSGAPTTIGGAPQATDLKQDLTGTSAKAVQKYIGDQPILQDSLFYLETNWRGIPGLFDSKDQKQEYNNYWTGAEKTNPWWNEVKSKNDNGDDVTGHTGLKTEDDASKIKEEDEIGKYHYYAITVDKFGRPVSKDVRAYGILSASYFYLTDHSRRPIDEDDKKDTTMFRYYYSKVLGKGQIPDGKTYATLDDFSASTPAGMRAREDYANWIDNMFKRRRNVTENVALYNDMERNDGKKRSYYGEMKYPNFRAVSIMYDVKSFNWIVGFGGLFIAMGVYNSFAFGMIQRIAELGILYMFSPVTLAFFPFDDGAQFNNAFVKPFYKKAISSYAPVLSLNLFFVILPAFDAIRWFQNGLLNTIAKCLVSIALLSMLPKVRTTIQTMLGADPMEEKKMFGKGGVLDNAGKNVMSTIKKPGENLQAMRQSYQFNKKRLAERAGIKETERKALVKEAMDAGVGDLKTLHDAGKGMGGAAARRKLRAQLRDHKLDEDALARGFTAEQLKGKEGAGIRAQQKSENKKAAKKNYLEKLAEQHEGDAQGHAEELSKTAFGREAFWTAHGQAKGITDEAELKKYVKDKLDKKAGITKEEVEFVTGGGKDAKDSENGHGSYGNILQSKKARMQSDINAVKRERKEQALRGKLGDIIDTGTMDEKMAELLADDKVSPEQKLALLRQHYMSQESRDADGKVIETKKTEEVSRTEKGQAVVANDHALARFRFLNGKGIAAADGVSIDENSAAYKKLSADEKRAIESALQDIDEDFLDKGKLKKKTIDRTHTLDKYNGSDYSKAVEQRERDMLRANDWKPLNEAQKAELEEFKKGEKAKIGTAFVERELTEKKRVVRDEAKAEVEAHEKAEKTLAGIATGKKDATAVAAEIVEAASHDTARKKAIADTAWSRMKKDERDAVADAYFTSSEGKKDLEFINSTDASDVNRRRRNDRQRTLDRAKLNEAMNLGVLKEKVDLETLAEMRKKDAWEANLYDGDGNRLTGTALTDAYDKMLDENPIKRRMQMGIENAPIGGVLGGMQKVGKGALNVGAHFVNPFKMVDTVQGALAKLSDADRFGTFGAIMDGLFDPDNGILMKNEFAKFMDGFSYHQTFSAFDKLETSKTKRKETEAYAHMRTHRFTSLFAENTNELAQMQDDTDFRARVLGGSAVDAQNRFTVMEKKKDESVEGIAQIVKNTGDFKGAIEKLMNKLGEKEGSAGWKAKEREVNTILNTGSEKQFQELFGEAKGSELYKTRQTQVFGNAAKMADVQAYRQHIEDYERAAPMAKNADGKWMTQEDYVKSLDKRKQQIDEYMGSAGRILGISDADKQEISRVKADLMKPDGLYIKTKRAYEAGEKPVVEVDGKMTKIDSAAAFHKFQEQMMKPYENAIKSKIDVHQVAYTDYGEKTGDRMDGILGAKMAGEQVKIMQDTVWKTNKETQQLFRDQEFVKMVEKSKWQELADQFQKASNGQENVFDKNLVAAANKGQMRDIGNMFTNMLGDADGEMRGAGFATANNIIARTFRMAFVDQITDSLKTTAGMLDQQQQQAFTARDNLITQLKGAKDSATQAMLRGCDISALPNFAHDDPAAGAAIERMQRNMQNNLEAQKHLDSITRDTLQKKIDNLFSNTLENLRLRNETNLMTYRIRQLTELDFQARNAVDRKGDKTQ